MVKKSSILYQIGIVSDKQYEIGKKSVDSLPKRDSFGKTMRNWLKRVDFQKRYYHLKT